MRKRPILLAAAVAAGVAALGTVMAQSPPGYAQPKQVPVPGTLPATTVRPASDWTPTPPRPGYQPTQPVQPAGGAVQQPGGQPRPRLTNPVMAGAAGVRPAGNVEIPPPSMELPTYRPGTAAAPPSEPPVAPLPPPSVAIDPPPGADPQPPVGSNPTPPLFPPGSGGGPESQPLVPVPPITTPAPIPQPPVGTPTVTPIPPPPARFPPIGRGDPEGLGVPAVGSTPVRSGAPGAALPARVSHSVTVEAVCPESIVFGQELRYELIVRNGGTAAVAGVRVEDEIPLGAKYVGSDPPAEMNGDRLAWNLGTVEGSGEKRITVRVKPADEGEVRSRASVSFVASVDAKTRVTRPRVVVSVTGGELCKAGDDAVFQIKVTNAGSGPAQRMVLQAKLSEGLLHPQGAVIEAELANLAPGDTKTVPLKVSATKAGIQVCQISVTAEGSADAIAKASVNVVEPMLSVKQTGPAKCLVRAEPVYEITLSNPGTAATDPVTLYTVLPEGFEYVQASDNAAYSATNRAIVWKLSGLAPGVTKSLSVKLRANAAVDGLLRTIAQATPEQPTVGTAGAGGGNTQPVARVLEAKTETAIKSEGVAAVRFEVLDLDDPVEVGKEAVYEIRVTNQGTGVCTNIQLVAALADGTTYTGSSGPTQVKAQGQNLIFEPIAQLGVKGEVVYRVRVRGSVAGEARFRVQLTSDQVRTPVVKEESTRFYKE